MKPHESMTRQACTVVEKQERFFRVRLDHGNRIVAATRPIYTDAGDRVVHGQARSRDRIGFCLTIDCTAPRGPCLAWIQTLASRRGIPGRIASNQKRHPIHLRQWLVEMVRDSRPRLRPRPQPAPRPDPPHPHHPRPLVRDLLPDGRVEFRDHPPPTAMGSCPLCLRPNRWT
jgi:hypothetical protein